MGPTRRLKFFDAVKLARALVCGDLAATKRGGPGAESNTPYL